jgi:hypothetical protein
MSRQYFICRDISCCPTGNIPTAFFGVGIFPVGQFCRDISFWHNVGIFPIGCVGTSTFPQLLSHKLEIFQRKRDLPWAYDDIAENSVNQHSKSSQTGTSLEPELFKSSTTQVNFRFLRKLVPLWIRLNTRVGESEFVRRALARILLHYIRV